MFFALIERDLWCFVAEGGDLGDLLLGTWRLLQVGSMNPQTLIMHHAGNAEDTRFARVLRAWFQLICFGAVEDGGVRIARINGPLLASGFRQRTKHQEPRTQRSWRTQQSWRTTHY